MLRHYKSFPYCAGQRAVLGQTPELVGLVFHEALPWATVVGRRLAKGPAHTRASLLHVVSVNEGTA